jgi:hypothetical protein
LKFGKRTFTQVATGTLSRDRGGLGASHFLVLTGGIEAPSGTLAAFAAFTLVHGVPQPRSASKIRLSSLICGAGPEITRWERVDTRYCERMARRTIRKTRTAHTEKWKPSIRKGFSHAIRRSIEDKSERLIQLYLELGLPWPNALQAAIADLQQLSSHQGYGAFSAA